MNWVQNRFDRKLSLYAPWLAFARDKYFPPLLLNKSNNLGLLIVLIKMQKPVTNHKKNHIFAF